MFEFPNVSIRLGRKVLGKFQIYDGREPVLACLKRSRKTSVSRFGPAVSPCVPDNVFWAFNYASKTFEVRIFARSNRMSTDCETRRTRGKLFPTSWKNGVVPKPRGRPKLVFG